MPNASCAHPCPAPVNAHPQRRSPVPPRSQRGARPLPRPMATAAAGCTRLLQARLPGGRAAGTRLLSLNSGALRSGRRARGMPALQTGYRICTHSQGAPQRRRTAAAHRTPPPFRRGRRRSRLMAVTTEPLLAQRGGVRVLYGRGLLRLTRSICMRATPSPMPHQGCHSARQLGAPRPEVGQALCLEPPSGAPKRQPRRAHAGQLPPAPRGDRGVWRQFPASKPAAGPNEARSLPPRAPQGAHGGSVRARNAALRKALQQRTALEAGRGPAGWAVRARPQAGPRGTRTSARRCGSSGAASDAASRRRPAAVETQPRPFCVAMPAAVQILLGPLTADRDSPQRSKGALTSCQGERVDFAARADACCAGQMPPV
jgi:hypothetical protein